MQSTVQEKALREKTEELLKIMGIWEQRDMIAVNLPYGQQRKLEIARALATDPKLLLLDEPTRGIDVGAKREIHQLMSKLADQGVGIIMISSEMSELIGMSDRIMVMCDGRCTGFIDGDKANQENIMELATQFE